MLLLSLPMSLILQLEDFLVGFRKIDNVFRASKDVLKATGLMAVIIWVGCGALFFIFEQSNPNFRECDPSIPLRTKNETGCYDFESTAECAIYYGEGMCVQTSFSNMPDSLYYVAVFLGGEWGVGKYLHFSEENASYPSLIHILHLCFCLFLITKSMHKCNFSVVFLFLSRFYMGWKICLYVPLYYWNCPLCHTCRHSF